MKVLLVEDSVILGEAIRDHVIAMGHAVVWCATLGEACAAAAGSDFGVVLLDLRLPDGSGLALLQALRAAKVSVPVVVLTAFDQTTDQMEALRCGATDFLTKPFSLARLAHSLTAVTT
ncbi:response regulator [Rhizobium sp. DKSPLA3]|uniref:Response regulator n=1 Tax=Rhizobium quercicola TaxID=2901226 RepID=A0A9X1NUL1_9HYPH|nr:response regulator [Rhizobium quercicola]MCD7111495.1 response regulator [Rhizobium quercicola]